MYKLKKLEELRGIGNKARDKLLKAGYDKVEQIYEIFKNFEFDSTKCQAWLKKTCGVRKDHALWCYEDLKKYYDEEMLHDSAADNQHNNQPEPPETVVSLQNPNLNIFAEQQGTNQSPDESGSETVKIHGNGDKEGQNIMPLPMSQQNNQPKLPEIVSAPQNSNFNTSAECLDVTTVKISDESGTKTVKMHYNEDDDGQNEFELLQLQVESSLQNPNLNTPAEQRRVSENGSTNEISDENSTAIVKMYCNGDEDGLNIISPSMNQQTNQPERAQTVSPPQILSEGLSAEQFHPKMTNGNSEIIQIVNMMQQIIKNQDSLATQLHELEKKMEKLVIDD